MREAREEKKKQNDGDGGGEGIECAKEFPAGLCLVLRRSPAAVF